MEKREGTLLHAEVIVESSGRKLWQHMKLQLWKVLKAVIGSLDFLYQEPLKASGQRNTWAELCGRLDMTGRDRGWRQDDWSGNCCRNPPEE